MKFSPRTKAIALFSAFFACLAVVLVWAILPLLVERRPVATSKILAADGSLLYAPARDGGFRAEAKLGEISESLIKSVVATEDKRFYDHHGIDWSALLRAAYRATFKGDVTGASTIEQQLLKNLYYPEAARTPAQKVREMMGAQYWAYTHSKQETLELYLNTVPFGNGAYGVRAAAERYFHKSPSDLTLTESALLAGIIAAPSRYEPIRHREASEARFSVALDRLKRQNLLSADQNLEFPLVFRPKSSVVAPHFVAMASTEAENAISAFEDRGLDVVTTLDRSLQVLAEETVTRELIRLSAQQVSNASVVVLDVPTGEIRALVGSADWSDETIDGQINMATRLRQPGSALKPFLYYEAFVEGHTPAEVISDLPVRYETDKGAYYPRNFSHSTYGPVTLRDALGNSLNIPAVKLLNQIGVGKFSSVLEKFGLRLNQAPQEYGLPLVLGGAEVKLLDLTAAYADLARGAHLEPHAVNSVGDQKLISKSSTPISNPEARYLVSEILSDQGARGLVFGETSPLDFSGKVAVKTGTTQDYRDNWAFAYTDRFAVGVWVGNADNSPMQRVGGTTGAAPIMRNIVTNLSNQYPSDGFKPPPNIVERQICLPSGLLANSDCPKSRTEVFVEGTEPKKSDDWYCRDGRELYLRLPAEYTAYAARKKLSTPPSGSKCEPKFETLRIISPLANEVFEIDPHLTLEAQKIPLVSGGQRRDEFHWTLNGIPLKVTESIVEWEPRVGDYELRLDGSVDIVNFSVR